MKFEKLIANSILLLGYVLEILLENEQLNNIAGRIPYMCRPKDIFSGFFLCNFCKVEEVMSPPSPICISFQLSLCLFRYLETLGLHKSRPGLDGSRISFLYFFSAI